MAEKGFTAFFAHFIIKLRWPIVIGVLLITLYFTYLLRYVSLPQELADIHPKGHKNVLLQEYMDDAFGVGTMVSIAMEVKEGDIFNPTSLTKLHDLCEDIYKLKGVMKNQVLSVACKCRIKNLRTELDEDGYSTLMVESWKDLVEKAIADPDFMPDYRQMILNNENLYGRMVSWDKKSTIMMATFWSDKEFKYLFKEILRLTKEAEDDNHNFYVAGRVVEMGWLHHYMGNVIQVFGIATAAVISILFIAFGTWRGILMPMWAAYVAVVWGLSLEYLLGMEMDIMTVIVPFMIMAIEVSHCVQILNRFYEEFDKSGDNEIAAEETLRGLVIPGVASIVTDGAGFGTLILIPFRLLQQMGISAAFGILRIFFTTTVFIHAFVAVLPTPTEKEMAKVHRRDKFFKAILARLSDFTLGSTRYAVIGGAGVVLMIGLIGAFRVEVGDMEEGSPLFWADSEYNQAEKILNGSFLGTSPYMLHLRGDKPGALAKPEVVQAVHTLQKHLEERQDVGGTISYMEVVKGINMAWHNNDPRWYVLPLHYQQIWGTMESFRQAGGPDDSKIYYELDFSEGTLAVFVKDHKGKTINSIVQYTDDFLKANVPEDSPVEVRQAAGIIGIYKAIMEKIKEGQTDSMWQISAVVFIFCLLTFRSPVAGLVVLVPLGLGTIITFATMGFGKIGLFIYTVPVASLGIGLGVDYSIYIVSRMKEELSLGKSYEEAHRETIVNAGKAVFFTAMSLALGVAMLLLSDIRFQAILGGMLMVVLLANMLGALVLLPALMSWWRPRFLMVRK